VLSENATDSDGRHAYVRHVRFGTSLERIEISWIFDDEGGVMSFYLRPAPRKSSIPESYQTRTELRLPFDGVWHVLQGGRNRAENYHAVDYSQRYGYDFRILRQGLDHAGEGKANADYHCWGRPVVAPGDGVVVAAVDGVPDNEPGAPVPHPELGNHVVIDHGNGEFSFLGHLERGSLRVEVSQAVQAGARIGACGNSGNSSEPHLHYHLQAGPTLDEGAGVPAQFRHYRANGVDIERGEPTTSQTIEHRAPAAEPQ
jgi:murein DD-endopeptidase MepM/ murein hydrolase activator NlpD